MASKFGFVAVVSVLVLFVSPIQSATPPPPPPPVPSPLLTSGPNYTAIAVGGMVFCKFCKLPGYVSYLTASPVGNVVVRVSCFDENWKLISKSTATNAAGFFYITWTDLASYDPARCRAYVDWSPLTYCNVPQYSPGAYGSYLYLVEEKLVPGGKQGSYSPGVIFLTPPRGAICPAS